MGYKWKELEGIIEAGLNEKAFPGGVLYVVKRGETVFKKAFGVTDYLSKESVTFDTVYDLASLTKPLATTLAAIVLKSEKRINIDLPVSYYIREVKDKKKSITVSQLLNHTSGLPAHREYFRDLLKKSPGTRKKNLRKILAEENLEEDPGNKHIYSDIGYMFLEWIIERITEEKFDTYIHSLYERMGIKDLFFRSFEPDNYYNSLQNHNYAPTENCIYRGLLKGFVHDDNCWAVGGVCGHAGLFGKAQGVLDLLLEIVSSYKGEGKFLNSEVVRDFLKRDKTYKKPLGFDSPDEKNSSCGKYFSNETVGHLGFTGTSIWIDLERDIIVILLTNRVHPVRENIKIRKFRPLLHDAVMEELT